jgi:hypothetical protein
MTTKKAFKEKDRVRRSWGEGCLGTVQQVREEVTSTSGDVREKGLLISVLWDNGTLSYFSPEGLDIIEAAK